MQTRRGFLYNGMLALLSLSPALLRAGWLRGESDVVRRVRALFSHPGPARSVGSRYLATGAAAAAATRGLRAALQASAPRDTAALRVWLGHRARQDFARERVVLLEGWVLAETEAQTCALALDA